MVESNFPFDIYLTIKPAYFINHFYDVYKFLYYCYINMIFNIKKYTLFIVK